MEVTASKLNKFLMFKLPSAYLCGVRLKSITNEVALVTVKYKWINQNPFNSMYFAVQSMAAELATGALVIKQIRESERNISMLVVHHSGTFTKKAVGKISFTCTDGAVINKALQRTIESGEGQTITMKAVGVNEKGEQVAVYEFVWSVKLKTK